MIARTAVAQARAIARRTLAESRIRDGAFALFFLLFAYANPVGYRRSYPTLHERLAFARSFGTNKAFELFYGVPQDLLTTGGFTAWRFGGFDAVITGIRSMLARFTSRAPCRSGSTHDRERPSNRTIRSTPGVQAGRRTMHFGASCCRLESARIQAVSGSRVCFSGRCSPPADPAPQ
jgi:hypothetical protein